MSSPLPFLKDKPQTSIITEHRNTKDDGQDMSGLEAAAMDLLKAIESKDHKSIASALQNAFELCEMMAHQEGPNE